MKKMQWGGGILCFPEQTYHRIILYHQVAHYTEIISFSAVSSLNTNELIISLPINMVHGL